MKLSELIEKLQEELEKEGDIDVVIEGDYLYDDLAMEEDTKIILRSRPSGRQCPVLKEVREWIKNNPKKAKNNGWVLGRRLK